eukprot:580743-Pleurochrysis_carterae.AAC.1
MPPAAPVAPVTAASTVTRWEAAPPCRRAGTGVCICLVTTTSPNAPKHFQRTLGSYPLRSRQAAALLLTRACPDKPSWGRSTGCAWSTDG